MYAAHRLPPPPGTGRAEPMFAHRPVMLDAAVDALQIDPAGTYVDATFGRGGHARAILARLGEAGRLHAFDRDPEAAGQAERLAAQDPRLRFHHACYSTIGEVLDPESVDGVLFDLGVSSPQLDEAQRGFSFLRDGPLDMRMNPQEGFSAADWIASADEREIADVLFRYGDERASRRIARRIVAHRERESIRTTGQLAAIIASALGGRRGRRHPATRSFQAIRMHVNDEPGRLQAGLDAAVRALRPGGRIVVISFHSFEDRIVKRTLRALAQARPPVLSRPQRRFPEDDEVAVNPRARSAVMRYAERLP